MTIASIYLTFGFVLFFVKPIVFSIVSFVVVEASTPATISFVTSSLTEEIGTTHTPSTSKNAGLLLACFNSPLTICPRLYRFKRIDVGLCAKPVAVTYGAFTSEVNM